MQEVFEAIAEIEQKLEREIEWNLTDHVEKKDINFYLQNIYDNLREFYLVADRIQEEQANVYLL